MKPVDVAFKRVEVTKYDSRAGTVEFRIIVNDGKDKAIVRNQVIDDCAALAEDVFREVRTKLKTLHASATFDDEPLAGLVMVRIQGDEEVVIERLSKFFASIKEKLRNAKMRRLSYYDIERQVAGLKTDL